MAEMHQSPNGATHSSPGIPFPYISIDRHRGSHTMQHRNRIINGNIQLAACLLA